MFNFLKKQKGYLVAPVSGRTIKLSKVADPVFSSGMMGVGIAIEPTGDQFVAPGDCTITLIPESKHAFGMQFTNGLEVLVHIGMDTVNLGGQGFTTLVEQGIKVTRGTPIIKIDREFFMGKNISLVTPIVVLNHSDYNVNILVEQGECVGGITKIINF